MNTIPLDSTDLLKLGLAVLVGGLIGVEREFRDKAAGFRTIVCICVGATLYTILSIKLTGGESTGVGGFDPSRLAAAVVMGVGFLGAGAILRHRGQVIGLTTAASIWLVAALGVGIGAGAYWLSVAAALIVLVVLTMYPMVASCIDRGHERRSYLIRARPGTDVCAEAKSAALEGGLRVSVFKRMKDSDGRYCVMGAYGHRDGHEALVSRFLDNPDVVSLKF